MFTKLSYTWALMRASWEVLRCTKGLVVFPLLSGLCCLAVVASFIVPLAITGAWQPPQGNAPPEQKVLYYVMLFAFYFCNYAVITFFNAAVISGAVARMTGGEPTVASCLGEAAKRIHLILGWALVSATVGLILRLIEDRSPKIGQFVAGLLGAAWALVSFLVVPALVVDNMGPIAALKQSGKLLRKSWGEQLAGNFSFGLIFFLMMLPSLALVGLGVYLLGTSHNVPLAIACIGLGVVSLIALALVQSTLQAIFQAALYLYTKGVHENGFPAELMCDALRPKE
jgi:Family of unknown function (DUF6159)